MMHAETGRWVRVLLTAVSVLLGSTAAPALAATEKSKKSAAPRESKSVKFMPGSQESPKERTARLKRECKGQVNAGACEGHTR